MSSQPRPLGVDIPGGLGVDKMAHFVVYGGLAGLVSVGLRRSETRLSVPWQFWFPILFAAAYGVTDEFHQLFVPQRTFSVADMGANAAGGFAAQAFLWYVWWRPRKTAPMALEGAGGKPTAKWQDYTFDGLSKNAETPIAAERMVEKERPEW